ncbi:MAG: cytochrome c biogenesis protein CcsA [Deltaproteobacteria bacterium]|nr:cytochrome c biogenesis protein CcsA [Deltaproteobacteria bacterium]
MSFFQHKILGLHLLLSLGGIVCWVVAASFSFLFLLQEHALKRKHAWISLPALEILDRAHYRWLSLGFWMFTAGMVIGLLAAKVQLGQQWSFNPVQLWTLAGWGIFAVLLFFRARTGLRGKRAVLYSLIGFIGVLFFSWIGVSYLFPGVHQP